MAKWPGCQDFKISRFQDFKILRCNCVEERLVKGDLDCEIELYEQM